MMKPIVSTQTCNRTLSATRFWINFRCPISGWLLIKNLDTAAIIRFHFDESGNEDGSFIPINPLHSKPFQVDEGDDVWVSSGTDGSRVRFECAKYKPVLDEFPAAGENMVGNDAFFVTAVAATTTYDCASLQKGYGSYFQVSGDVGGFVGTVEWSRNNGLSYSSPIVMDSGDPLKRIFEDNAIVTNIRVTRTAGTFSIYYR